MSHSKTRATALAALCLALIAPFALTASTGEELTAEAVVDRYVEARGGAESWSKVKALAVTGTYAAFSEKAPFELLKHRGDLYRLEFTLLGETAIRARDEEGPWMQHGLLTQGMTARIGGQLSALAPQFERESYFEPALIAHREKEIGVELVGHDEIDGQPTVVLKLSFPEEREETWHLDAETYLEVAVDQQVFDFTQGGQPITMRTFFQGLPRGQRRDSALLPRSGVRSAPGVSGHRSGGRQPGARRVPLRRSRHRVGRG